MNKDDGIDRDRYSNEYISQHEEKEFSMEAVLSEERRAIEMCCIDRYEPSTVLEVGCGLDPLFNHTTSVQFHTVVEPVDEFVERARSAAADDTVTVIHGELQEVTDQLDKGYDLIVLSSLLHEVPDPDELLAAVREITGPETKVHLNVPNVRSFHRLLAYEMGVIDRIDETSEMESRFQRHTHFDEEKLRSILDENGFDIEEFGTYFIKPFSNAQLEEILKQEIADESLIRGLRGMSKHLPEMGAEMYAVATLKS